MEFRNNLSHSIALEQCKTIGVKDGISALPEELLLEVLKRLALREAAKTSTLSKRWRYSWGSRPTLDLDCISWDKVPAFEHTLYSILRQYNSPKLHELRIAGVVPWSCVNSIDGCICFAINKAASKLELAVSLSPFSGHRSYYCVPAHPFCAMRVDSLTYLCLKSVTLSTEVFDLILTSCCHLESFLLMFSNGPVYAKNTTPHLNLKLIRFYLCDGLEIVQLWAPNLLSFDYNARQGRIDIKDCKQLRTLTLASASRPSVVCPKVFVSQFSSYLPTLESLIIDVHLFKNKSNFAELGLLGNLKLLVLDAIVSAPLPLMYKVAASVLRAAPYLQLLEINLPATHDAHLSWKRRALKLASISLHQNLLELKLTGFRGDPHTMDFVAYILENTASLQKIDITPRFRVQYGCVRSLSSDLVWKEDEFEVCNEFMQQLRQRLPINASLFFHDVQ